MHQSIDCGGRGHSVFEDAIPLAEDEVAGDHQAASFVAFGEERQRGQSRNLVIKL